MSSKLFPFLRILFSFLRNNLPLIPALAQSGQQYYDFTFLVPNPFSDSPGMAPHVHVVHTISMPSIQFPCRPYQSVSSILINVGHIMSMSVTLNLLSDLINQKLSISRFILRHSNIDTFRFIHQQSLTSLLHCLFFRSLELQLYSIISLPPPSLTTDESQISYPLDFLGSILIKSRAIMMMSKGSKFQNRDRMNHSMNIKTESNTIKTERRKPRKNTKN